MKLTESVEFYHAHRVPKSAFFCKSVRDKFIADTWCAGKYNKISPNGTKLRSMVYKMMVEVELMWYYFHLASMEPLHTQVQVDDMGVATAIDLLVRDRNGKVRVGECKCGCREDILGEGMMLAPLNELKVSSHTHYELQTLINNELYKRWVARNPIKALGPIGPPILWRVDTQELSVYLQFKPQITHAIVSWAVDHGGNHRARLASIQKAMTCSQ